MKLRSMLILGGALAVALVLGVGGVILVVNRGVDRILEVSLVTNEIRRANSELILVAYEYVGGGSERAQTQWVARRQSQGALLERFTPPDAESGEMAARADAAYSILGAVFDEIVTTREARASATSEDAALLQAKEARLISKLTVTLNNMAVASRGLDRHVQDVLVRTQKRGATATFAAVAVLAVMLAAVFFVVGRTVLGPLHRLQEGASVIGSGDLRHRIGLASRDEIGELGRAFDRMVVDLETVTVSRDDLEEQIAWRVRIEEALRAQTVELARSNEELEQFAYVASHDLQEPLRMVVSYLQIIERRYKEKLDSDADEFIEYAVQGARRMQAMIEDLLVLSRVGTKGGVLEPVESLPTLEAAVENLRMKIEESGADVAVEGELPVVMADPRQLVQLFQNLISNSLKFRGEGPPRVRVSAVREDERWVFAVRDNGIGIEAQYTERIFDVFQRLHGRDEYPGTGIGLSICKKIVERHGGRLWVEGGPGEGSTFFFTLSPANAET